MSANNHTQHSAYILPDWVAVALFIAIMAALWIFGDLFTFILGLIVETLVFAGAYNRLHSHD